MNGMEKVFEVLTSNEKRQRSTRSLMNQGVSLLYMFAALLFMQAEYTLAVCAVIVSLGLGHLRELVKDFIELKRKDGHSKNTK